jgi:hypothetical protein
VFFTKAEGMQEEVTLSDLIDSLQESPLLTLAADPEIADLKVVAYDNAVFRFFQAGNPVAVAAFRIPVKKARALPQKLLRILEQMAAYRNLYTLKPATDILKNSTKIEFLRLVVPATRRRAAEVAPLNRNEADEILLKSGENLAISVSNLTSTPLYCYVVVLDPRQQSVSLVYPYKLDQPAKLRPDETILIGSGPDYQVEMQLPEAEPVATDIFQVWISTSSIQPAILLMPPLGQRVDIPTDPYGSGSRLDRELRQAILGKVGSAPIPNFNADPWWSQKQTIRVEKAEGQ